MKKKLFLLASAISCLAGTAAPLPVHYDVDPPVVIDGSLKDWADVPALAVLTGTKKLVRNRGSEKYKYSGDKDLSAVLKVLWRPAGLKIAGKVTDNVHIQQGDQDIWAGDHLDLRLDMTPATVKEREDFGEGQFQFLLSPGDFNKKAPQIQVVQPEGMQLAGAQIAAVKTSYGYDLEAFIPWEGLNCGKVSFNRIIALDIFVSDSDCINEKQQKIKVLGALPLSQGRSRLQQLVTADGSGKADILAPAKLLNSAEGTVKKDQPFQLDWELSAEDVKNKAYLLEFAARADFSVAGGFASGMLNVEVNGKMLTADQLFGIPDSFTMRNGENLSLINSTGALTLPWAPDYQAADKHPKYSIPGRKTTEFVFNLSGLLKPGKNSVIFKVIPNRRNQKAVLKVNFVKLITHPAGLLVDPARPPAGKLPFYSPEAERKLPLYKNFQTKANKLSFTLNGEPVQLQSEFMSADSPWGDLSRSLIRHQRQIEQKAGYILVRDKFFNSGKTDAGIMQKHTLSLPNGIRKALINGNEFNIRYNSERELSSNPSIIALTANGSVGLLPWSDALSVHGIGGVNNGNLILADYELVIAPQTEHIAEFIIVPWDKANYWSWINQTRKITGANMPITLLPGLWMGSSATRLSASRQRSMIGNFGLNAVIQSNNCARDSQGLELRGTDWIDCPLTEYHAMRKNLDRWYPDKSVKQLVYFHCFLETTTNNIRQLYNRDLIRLANGKTTVYGSSRGNNHLHCILPNPDGWGKVGEQWIDTIFDKIKADGVFWDEFSVSNIKYAYNPDRWDNVSGDIDRQTGKVIRKKSSVTLLTQPWRIKMVDKIRKQGKYLIINGAPRTQKVRAMKIQTMFETGNISSLNQAHLASPVALGDHLTEKNFDDAWRIMLRALDYGSLYCAYYTYKSYPRQHKAMTCWMYPFTPIELHKGYVIGKERIITRISGCFGWGDKSEFEAKVFDANGKLTNQYPVKKVTHNGQNFAEVRIPANCAAVIIRK